MGMVVYRALVVLLLGGAVFGLWRQGAFAPWLAAPDGQPVEALATRLSEVETTLQMQSSALGQALGQAVPLQLSQQTEKALSALEGAVASTPGWPADAQGVQALNDRLLALLKPLPPWAQDALLPRLLPLKWQIHALWILRAEPPAEHAALSNFEANLRAHLDEIPAGVTPPLPEALREHATKVTANLRKATLAQASKFMAEPPPVKAEDDRRGERAAALLGTLADPEDDEVRKLRAEIEAMALRQAAAKALKDAQDQRTLATKTSDPALSEHALQQARHGLLELRLRLAALQPAATGELAAAAQKAAEEIRAIDGTLRKQHADRMQRYQVQALQALKQVKPIGTFDFGPDKKKELATQLIGLAWIDRGLLDPAVADWFHTVYKRGFEQLDDAQKLRVVDAFATTPKRGLD